MIGAVHCTIEVMHWVRIRSRAHLQLQLLQLRRHRLRDRDGCCTVGFSAGLDGRRHLRSINKPSDTRLCTLSPFTTL